MRFVLALAFLLCFGRDAAALQKASAQDQQEIANYLGVIVAAEDGIKRANDDLNDAPRVQFRSATLDGQGVRYDEARCQDYTST